MQHGNRTFRGNTKGKRQPGIYRFPSCLFCCFAASPHRLAALLVSGQALHEALGAIKPIHTGWLDTSVWMSAAPLVSGNKSTRFHQNKSTGLLPSSPSPSVNGNKSTLPVLPNNSGQGGGTIASTLRQRRVHGDFHRLNLNSSTTFIRIPPQPVA